MNLGTMKEAVAYARSLEGVCNKTFRFTVTTNAVLLNESTMQWLNKEMDNIVLSIDGRQQTHDRMRPTKGQTGSYHTVAENIARAIEMRGHKSYYARATYTSHNLDFSKDVLHMASLGIHNISAEPVVCSFEEEYAIKEEHLSSLMREYDLLAEIYLERRGTKGEFSFFHFNVDTENSLCMRKRMSGCGAGCEYLAVTPKGELYPCHQFVGLEDFAMGNVFSGISPGGEKVREEFFSLHPNSKENCKGCWAKYFCGGGCHAVAYLYGTGIEGVNQVSCELMKKRLECALYLKSKEIIEEGLQFQYND